MFDRREFLLAGGAGIAQLGQRVLPRVTLPQLLAQSRVPALGGAIVTGKGPADVEVDGRRRSGHGERAERDDVWLIGSNTQAMTALLYGRLAEIGKLRWNVTLPDLFPSIPVDGDWAKVRIEDVMAHVAGVSDAPFATPGALHKWFTDTRPIAVQRMAFARAILSAPPAGRPGDYVFSNAGYVIVGAAIEQAMKLPWEAVISSEMFGPLGLDSAGFGAPTGAEPWGHARLDQTHLVQINPLAEAADPPVFGPASLVHLSLSDYGRFVQLFLTGGGDYVDPKTVAKLVTPIGVEASGPALGWLVSAERNWAGGPVLSATTSSGYWSADVQAGPGKGLAAISVANAGGVDFGGAAVQRLSLSLIQSRVKFGA